MPFNRCFIREMSATIIAFVFLGGATATAATAATTAATAAAIRGHGIWFIVTTIIFVSPHDNIHSSHFRITKLYFNFTGS
jgi:hypothetical protein